MSKKNPGSRRSRKLLAAALTTAAAAAVYAQAFPPFPDPAVGPFPDTANITLLSQLLPAEIGAVTPRSGVLLNDIWGWTSPNGEEYALVGTGDGMSIVRVTDPEAPEFIGIMETRAPDDFANLWGDVAVYNVALPDGRGRNPGRGVGSGRNYTGYAYYTTEADGVGVSILELNQLDSMGPIDPSLEDAKIQPTAVFDGGGYESSHNIYINQESGYAYIAGAELESEGDDYACAGEPFAGARFHALVLDVAANPLEPQIVACRADAAEHDFYVVNYKGPDNDYRNREIAFVFDGRDYDVSSRGGTRVDDTPGAKIGGTTEIWDVTDKDNIEVIASFSLPDLCFSHQGWTSSDRHEFLLINDELDELRDAEPEDGFFRNEFCASDIPPETLSGPSFYVVNIQDLDNPIFQERFEVDSPGDNDHNFVRKGNKLYWAAYNAGTRVIRMQERPNELRLAEVAVLDSEPRDAPVFFGQWGIFPFPDSDTIVASDINNGLMIMELDDQQPLGNAPPTVTTGRPDSPPGLNRADIERIKARLR